MCQSEVKSAREKEEEEKKRTTCAHGPRKIME
jgi:hypothetical protein